MIRKLTRRLVVVAVLAVCWGFSTIGISATKCAEGGDGATCSSVCSTYGTCIGCCAVQYYDSQASWTCGVGCRATAHVELQACNGHCLVDHS